MGTGALDELFKMTPGDAPPETPFTGSHAVGISPFAVAKSATLSCAAAHIAAHQLGSNRGLSQPVPTINRDHALGSFSGSISVNGRPVPKWAPLSGMYETADDRFVQIHCNFAHHAQGVVDLLGCSPGRSDVEAAIKTWQADEFEAALILRGMVGAKYRSLEEWSSHPHALATATLPLMSVERLGAAAPRMGNHPVGRPMDDVRVLDCSRVLAGPVAGQTMAAHGADVLRVGAEHLPSVDSGVMSTGFGKRNTFVNLDTGSGRETFGRLLSEANVFVDAFRPGALQGRGFAAEDAAEVSPGIVVVQLCAFDWTGPWAGRRGFDSIVQTTTGLAVETGSATGSDTPVHLPVQALDYATGYLATHAVFRLLAYQQIVGGSWLIRLSLLRTRNWLVNLFAPAVTGPLIAPPSVEPWLHTVDSEFGRLTAPRTMAGHWDRPPAPLGSSPAQFD